MGGGGIFTHRPGPRTLLIRHCHEAQLRSREENQRKTLEATRETNYITTHMSSKFVFQIRFWPPLYMHASKATKYHKLLKESDKNLAQLLLVENTEILKD